MGSLAPFDCVASGLGIPSLMASSIPKGLNPIPLNSANVVNARFLRPNTALVKPRPAVFLVVG